MKEQKLDPDKERGKAYTIKFIDDHGGVEQVARNTGLNRQTLRQTATGRNYPGFEVIAKLNATYPDFDLKHAVAMAPKINVPVSEGEEGRIDGENSDLDPKTVRLLTFIEENGGPSVVARKLGFSSPSLFYNYSGRNKQPASEVLQLFAEHYPDFDPYYILTGRLDRSKPSPTNNIGAEVLQAENAGLRKEVARLEQTVTILQSIVGNQMGIDLHSKTKSTGDATQGTLFGLDYMITKGVTYRPVLSMRDAKPTSRVYPNQAPQQPPRHP